MKMEQIECSETSAYKIQMPGNYPEENIQHTEHGKSLKSRKLVDPNNIIGVCPVLTAQMKCFYFKHALRFISYHQNIYSHDRNNNTKQIPILKWGFPLVPYLLNFGAP
jgi:hypothetical protein